MRPQSGHGTEAPKVQRKKKRGKLQRSGERGTDIERKKRSCPKGDQGTRSRGGERFVKEPVDKELEGKGREAYGVTRAERRKPGTRIGLGEKQRSAGRARRKPGGVEIEKAEGSTHKGGGHLSRIIVKRERSY